MLTFTFPNPAGGSMAVQGANFADAQQQAAAQGWTPSMGTFGANSGPGAGGGSSGGGGAAPTGPQGFNQQAADAAARVADNAAQQAYLRARLNLDTDIEAHRQAQQTWQNTFDQQRFQWQQQQETAGLTGYLPNASGAGGGQSFGNGQFVKSKDVSGGSGWSIGQIQNGKFVPFTTGDDFAKAGGDWSQVGAMPTVDPQTFVGMANGTINPITAGQGTPTLAREQQQFQQGFDVGGLMGVYNGSPTLAAQQEQNRTSLGYLDLISRLQGPADYGNYLRTLGSTPGGLRDLVASAAGKYVPASGASTGVAPQAASLGGLVNAAATGQSGARAAAGGGVVNTAFEAPVGAAAQKIGQGANGQPGGGTTYADYMRVAQGLPAPNQISPDAWNAFTGSQRQALLGMYGQTGYVPQDVSDLYQQSLPKYAYSGTPTGSVKL